MSDEEEYRLTPATTKEEKLSELVFQALGQASMCWEIRPKGVFDSDQVKEIGDQLIKDLKELFVNG